MEQMTMTLEAQTLADQIAEYELSIPRLSYDQLRSDSMCLACDVRPSRNALRAKIKAAINATQPNRLRRIPVQGLVEVPSTPLDRMPNVSPFIVAFVKDAPCGWADGQVEDLAALPVLPITGEVVLAGKKPRNYLRTTPRRPAGEVPVIERIGR